MKTYTAKTDQEAAALFDGTQTLLVIPCKPQLPFESWCRANGNLYGIKKGGESTGYIVYPDNPHIITAFYKESRGQKEIVCPYSHGDEIGVKEKHRPASRILMKTIRTHLLCKRAFCEKLSDVTGRQIFAFGIDNGDSNPTMGKRYENMQHMALQERWGKLYPKYPYASDPWCWLIQVERKEST